MTGTVAPIAPHEVPAVLRFAVGTFGPHKPPSEPGSAAAWVRRELIPVEWPLSVRAEADGRIVGVLLLSRSDLAAHCRSAGIDGGAYAGLRCVRGEAFAVRPEARGLAPAMVRLMLRLDADCFWGTSMPGLGAMGLWRRHAAVLGLSAAGDEWVFARLRGSPRPDLSRTPGGPSGCAPAAPR